MMFRIVPNEVRDAINKKLDDALKEFPEAECEREHLYVQLLDYFDMTGQIPPNIGITKSTDASGVEK